MSNATATKRTNVKAKTTKPAKAATTTTPVANSPVVLSGMADTIAKWRAECQHATPGHDLVEIAVNMVAPTDNGCSLQAHAVRVMGPHGSLELLASEIEQLATRWTFTK